MQFPKRPSEPWSCPLCGAIGKPQTEEHVIPHWMYKYWGRSDTDLYLDSVRLSRKYVVVVVCEDCQRWLNRKFENPARLLLIRLMSRKPTTLTRADQDILGRYLSKQLLLMNLWSHFDTDPYLTVQDYRRLRARGLPPLGTQVWLGAVEDADPVREQAVVRAVPELGPPPAEARPRLVPVGSSVHVMSFSALVVTWLCIRQDLIKLPLRPKHSGLLHVAEHAGLLLRVWPPRRRDIDWPPKLSLDVTTYGRWSERLGYIAPRKVWGSE